MRILLRGGTVVPVDPALPTEFVADILIEGSRIAAVAPNIGPSSFDGEIIDVAGMIVTPGLIDTHRHTWQSLLKYIGADWTIADYAEAAFRVFGPRYAPDDMYIALRLGLAEALDAGVTQVLDWNHNLLTPEHADETVRAHRDSLARVVFAYGQSSREWQQTYPPDSLSAAPPSKDIVRIRDRYYPSSDQLLTLALAARGPEKAPPDIVAAEWSQARALGIRITVHVGNGIRASARPVQRLRDSDLLRDDTTYVHCSSLSDEEIALIASSGGKASCAPEIEANMGHGNPAVLRLVEAGVRPSLSVDTCTNSSGDLFGAMRATLATARLAGHARYLAQGKMAPEVALSARQVFEFATIEGARANGLADRTGSLSPGKEADIVIFSCAAPNMFPVNQATATVVKAAHAGNVDSVFVAGVAVKRNGVFLAADLKRLRADAEARRDALFDAAGPPYQRRP
jgi:5-methylthioadenosine/S-adenosylhomocysteine deaminase